MSTRGLPLLLVLILLAAAPARAQNAGEARVLSGDTLRIGEAVIRFYGVDAPEPRQTCRRDGVLWRCGAEATGALRGVIGARPVRCEEWDRDCFGRVVSVCHVGEVDLGATMVATDMALAYAKFSEAYGEREAAAKAAGRGMWAGRFVAPWDWRRGRRLE